MSRYHYFCYFLLLVIGCAIGAAMGAGAVLEAYAVPPAEEVEFTFNTLRDRYAMWEQLQALQQYQQIEEQYGDILRVLTPTDLEIIRKIANNVIKTHPILSPSTVKRSIFACSVAAKYHNVPVEKAVALAYIESTFKHRSKSIAACKGLTQLSSLVWRVYGEQYGMDSYDIYNPFANAVVGVGYFTALVKSHKGNEERALAFYNGGGNFGQSSIFYARKVLNVADMLKLYRNIKN